jgi:hypothetical protein
VEDGAEDLESGRREERYEDPGQMGRGGTKNRYIGVAGSVLLGMCMAFLCMLAGFLGIWFGVLGKGMSTV